MEADIGIIKDALLKALKLRPPVFESDLPGRSKVSELEDYLLSTAWLRAELEEALHWVDLLMANIKAQVEEITGYEVLLPAKSRDRITQQDIVAAKRRTVPEVFEMGAEVKQLRVSIVRQIDRFEHEAQWVISRAYTMVSGS